MTAIFVDPREETPALRRAALLLERLVEDGDGAEPELESLEAGVAAMLRFAAEGRFVPRSALMRLESIVVRLTEGPECPACTTTCEILRCNALAETRELLRRLMNPPCPRGQSPPAVMDYLRGFEMPSYVREHDQKRDPFL